MRRYIPKRLDGGPGKGVPSQRWSTFVRNHAQTVACDFCVAVTVTVRLLYVFVVIEHASRRILYVNVTGYPTAEWTLHQLREAILGITRIASSSMTATVFSHKPWTGPSVIWD